MDQIKKILIDTLGVQNGTKLAKAIFKPRSRSVIDPSEQLLGLLTAPRAILAWLVANIKPMKVGENKDLKFPGRDDITIHVEKQDVDVYRADFIQNGEYIHRFTNQSLPAMASHMVTTGELYDFTENQPQLPNLNNVPDSSRIPQDSPTIDNNHTFDAIKAILQYSNLSSLTNEDVKWMYAHANIKELTNVIGKLIDILMIKQFPSAVKIFNIPEISNDQHQITDLKSLFRRLRERSLIVNNTESSQNKSNDNIQYATLSKPYVSEAQRRWAHTPAGIKALGGKKAVEHWDKETKGRKLPEYASKKELLTALIEKQIKRKQGILQQKAEMPGGAGIPQKAVPPQSPKPPTMSSRSMQSQAAMQAQRSGLGRVATAKLPTTNAPMPKMPKSPKMPAVPKSSPVTVKVEANGFLPSKNRLLLLKKKNLKKITKNETTAVVSALELTTPCEHCGTPVFKYDANQQPLFTPCACFRSETSTSRPFVKIQKNSDGHYKLIFNRHADPQSVYAFLLLLKTGLLAYKINNGANE